MSGPVERRAVDLLPRNAAVVEGRTIFVSRVFDAGERDRVLVRGFHNAKIGDFVTKGAWKDMKIFTLTLEERATCPRSCAVWAACYGNGMPMSARVRYTRGLMLSLEAELEELAEEYPRGFVVRLHVLGDFPDLPYLDRWAVWLARFPQLRVWGYTAHPEVSAIGRRIRTLNAGHPDRWSVRFSVAPDAALSPMQAAAVWTNDAMRSEGVVCPQELGKTQTCGTCALCWNPNAAEKRILFLGHGGRGAKK